MDTRSKILNLLNREPSAVNELAAKLGISRNSTHLHVSQLEAEGLLAGKPRSEKMAGKPAKVYSVTAGSEDTYSQAHRPVLEALLSAIDFELPAKEKSQLLKKTGRVLSQRAGLTPSGQAEVDLERATDLVNRLGAMAEVTTDQNQLCVTSYSCPIGGAVHTHPDSCKLVESFFSSATGKKVTSRCRHGDTVVCKFVVQE